MIKFQRLEIEWEAARQAMIGAKARKLQAKRKRATALARHASTRPGDEAAILAEETGMDYGRALVFCNMD